MIINIEQGKVKMCIKQGKTSKYSLREACGGCVSSAKRSAAPKRQRSP
ncbi:MAG: hypothetical protein NZ455_02615 [Bacteroidia bacterium]|nr:hypothetical protein [Bacteroidia bacterium]MDW8347300.1 hypothetical protein [Bacteroidia bacterium]